MNLLPKVVVFEGINKSGKTTIIKQLEEKYGPEGKIKIIKFPHSEEIIRQIEFLFQIINTFEDTRPDIDIRIFLDIIHQLFDLDFRQFNTLEEMSDKTKLYILDRYFPSNLVYSKLHKVFNLKWKLYHNIIPDLVIYLRIVGDQYNKFINDFPATEYENTIDTKIQDITPDKLYFTGQDYYGSVLLELYEDGLIRDSQIVWALTDSTFKDVEKILIENGYLE